MKKLMLTILTISFFAVTYAQSPSDKRLKGLDTFAIKVLKDWNAAGVSIAVVEKGKVLYTGGYGYRDLEKKLPVTENTLFAIGSCTKAFTASLLGMLVNEGKINLDKPVRDYLPELRFQNEYSNNHVTLRDMMTHRTGLPRHDMSWYGSWTSRDEFIKRIQFMEPTAELREKWQYNNFMFLAQGSVIEKITGKTWEENMQERIFKPLGMDNSNLSTNDLEKSADRSLAYVTKDAAIHAIPYRNIDAMGPAGSVNSTAKDMAKWLITWINNGKYNGKEIIPSVYRNEAITMQMATGGGLPGKESPDVHISGYGLGWSINSYRGHYRVEHGGGIDGFISSTAFFPFDSIGIFVSSNQGGVTSTIRNFIADRMLNLAYRNWNQLQLDAVKKSKEMAGAIKKNDSIGHVMNTKPSQILSNYAGSFSNPAYGSIEIAMKDNDLVSKFNNIHIRLEHFHFDQFNAIVLDPSLGDNEPIRFSFHIDSKGEINKLTIPFQPGTKDIEFYRESKSIDVSKTDLEKYTGEFEFAPGAGAKFYTKANNTLFAFIEGQPEYELVATDKNKFYIKILPDFKIHFEENNKEEIVSVSFIQPNGTFKAFKKFN